MPMVSLLTYSLTPYLLIIGGFLLLSVAKLIEVQERSSETTAALLKQLLEMKNEGQAPAPSASENQTLNEADELESASKIEEKLPIQENERKYWNG